MDYYYDKFPLDVVNEFLIKIPEVRGFLGDKKIRKPQRTEVFHAIHERIAEQLDSENLPDEWLLQLIEFELEEENTPDKASYIAKLLTSYVVNRPWLFQPHIIRPKLSDSRYPVSEIVVSTRSKRDKKFIFDYENVAELLNHRQLAINEAAQVSHIMVNANRNEYLETANKRSEMLAKSDTILGIAGFLPFTGESETEGDGTSPPISSSLSTQKCEEDFISQYRNHIRLMRDPPETIARISFFPYFEKNEREAEPLAMNHAKLCIEHAIASLASQIKILQDKSGHFDQLLFIRARCGGIKTDVDQHYGEVASIEMGIVREFIHLYGEASDTFNRCLSNALDGDTREPPLFPRTATNPIPGSLFSSGTFIYQLTQQYSSTQRPASDLDAVRNLSPLLKTLEPILESMGTYEFVPSNGSQAAAVEILHVTASVVQSLCLMAQSYLRGLITPLHFEFLTSPIADFFLHGASPHGRIPEVFVRKRRLSCLGDMLKEDVLVFEPLWFHSHKRFDLVATTAQILSLWGPGELVIRKKRGFAIAVTRIKIQGGIIVPTGETIGGMQQWHWRPIKPTDQSEDLPIPNIHTGIDLHTQIRSGGGSSRLSLHPIGPATWNKDCPSSTKSVLDLSRHFSSNLRIVGVKDPFMSLKSSTVGLQAGQSASLIAQGNFEMTLGKTAKNQALRSIGFFEVQLAAYDQIWGLFVSLCTGVMTRVRLRELVAFFCLQCAVMEVPLLPGKSREESVDAFTDALCGKGRLIDWFESLIPESEKINSEKRETLQKRVLALFLNVLEMLEDTGISENGDLVLACLSNDKALNTLTLSANDHSWIKVLSDSSLTATFACISLHCFQARDCKCRNDKGNVPDEFRLATKLGIYAPSSCSPHDTQLGSLQTMKTYWINSSNLNLMAKVMGCVKESNSELIYYITIKKSVLPIDLIKHLRKKPILREDDSQTAVKCIISGGSKYLEQLEGLEQKGKMKAQPMVTAGPRASRLMTRR